MGNSNSSNPSASATIEIDGSSSEVDAQLLTILRWSHGGRNVAVTGTWCGWTQRIPLSRSGDDFFVIVPVIGKGKHQYKFIVDGEWRIDPQQPTEVDAQGNINNILDITKKSIFEEDKEESTDPLSPLGYGQFEALFVQNKKYPPLLPPQLPLSPLNSSLFPSVTSTPLSSTAPSPNSSAPVPLPPSAPPAPQTASTPMETEQQPALTSSFSPPPEMSVPSSTIRQFPSVGEITWLPDEGETAPPHVIIGHSFFVDAPDDASVLGVSTTTRFRQKFTTAVYYKSTAPQS